MGKIIDFDTFTTKFAANDDNQNYSDMQLKTLRYLFDLHLAIVQRKQNEYSDAALGGVISLIEYVKHID